MVGTWDGTLLGASVGKKVGATVGTRLKVGMVFGEAVAKRVSVASENVVELVWREMECEPDDHDHLGSTILQAQACPSSTLKKWAAFNAGTQHVQSLNFSTSEQRL